MIKHRLISDLLLAIFVIAIIAMLIIPLPTFLLDILIVINISFALLLLLVGLYMPNALSLLSFPTLLLLTTLFRLGLNVASTRLILSQANAGKVIQAFGTFLVRGEVLVGVIIFTIITVVNFIVIARGSSRVSIVAARFTLDSLPGKQSAIDSDLRAGLISNEDAVSKREDLRKESQLYGAMDGAMQFVQGDAIAGFFIILTNIFGGLYLGISRGQSFSDALNTYTTLTVGDGLVSQIPALLISICAGIVVTRVSSGEKATLSLDLSSQLFSNPLTLILSSVILFFLGLMPGLPFFPFFAVAMMFMISSILLRKNTNTGPESRRALDYQPGSAFSPQKFQAELFEKDSTDAITVMLDNNAGYKMYLAKAKEYHLFWDKLREGVYNDIGIRLPELKVAEDQNLFVMEYSITNPVSLIEKDSLFLDSVLLELNPDFSYLFNIKKIKETYHPVSGQRIFWAEKTDHLQQILKAADMRSFDFFEYICLRIAAYYHRNPQELITISDVYLQLKSLEKKFPGLVADVLSRNFVDVPRLCELLQMLVIYKMNIKDFRQIVEYVAAYCSSNSITAQDVDTAVLQDIASYIKKARSKHLYTYSKTRYKYIRVFTLKAEVEELLGQHSCNELLETGNSLLENSKITNLKNSLLDMLKPVFNKGLLPVYLLIRPDIRNNLEAILDFLNIPADIITFDEVGNDVSYEKAGVWGK